MDVQRFTTITFVKRLLREESSGWPVLGGTGRIKRNAIKKNNKKLSTLRNMEKLANRVDRRDMHCYTAIWTCPTIRIFSNFPI